MSLPTGIVTFLLTDVEGYSRLCEDHGPAMSGVIRRHLTQLTDLVHAHSGKVFKTVGDGVLAVFADATRAVRAAIDIQRALLTPEPLLGRAIAARIALHAGPAEAHDGDYVGRTINRAARLLSAGHGGQILLSAAAAELVRAGTTGVPLRDLGEHRLRDLQGDERIFQLVHCELPHEFPPLRTLDVRRSNLPSQLNSFFGRRAEMLALRAALDESRLVTLTGPGGVGKTRLALQSAARMATQFPGGVWFVELAGITGATPDQIAATIADVLSIKVAASAGTLAAAVSAIAAHIGTQRVLLILDNCEHLRASTAALVRSLLERSPHVRVLATSRESLHVPGEQVLPLGPLPLPDSADPSILATSETAQLFLERARLAAPAFRLNAHTAAAVAAIGRAVDGLPLGLELAAARLGGMDVRALADRLTQRVGHLGSLDPSAAPRHKTIDALIDWSYRLLTDPQRALLRRLSVIAGTFTLEAAEDIASDPPSAAPDAAALPPDAIADTLVTLVSASMIVMKDAGPDPAPDAAESRYRMLMPIHEFAAKRASEHPDELAAARRRHAEHYTRLAEHWSSAVIGPEQAKVLARLSLDLDNLRAAVAALRSTVDDAAMLGRLVIAIHRVLYLRGLITEGRQWTDDALRRHATPGDAPHALLLGAAGMFAWLQRDLAAASEHYRAAMHVWESLHDRGRVAGALSNLGMVLGDMNEAAKSRECHERASAIYINELRDPRGAASVQLNLGLLLGRTGDLRAARACFETCVTTFASIDPHRSAVAAGNLGEICWRLGDLPAAAAHIAACLSARLALSDLRGVTSRLPLAALLCLEFGSPELSAKILGHAQRLRDPANPTPAPSQTDPEHPDQIRARLAATIDPERVERHFAAGQTSTDTPELVRSACACLRSHVVAPSEATPCPSPPVAPSA